MVRLALLASLALGACQAEPDRGSDYYARPVVETERFEVVEAGRTIGWLVHCEIQDPTAATRFWRIVNARQQWVGHATEAGRFSRRVPFRDDEEDLGIWPMAKGVARLLDASGDVELRAVARPAEADARREPARN
jgi:hypothetical protein